MSANRSSAVMQQRRIGINRKLNYFPTPPFATRALCEFLEGEIPGGLSKLSAWEPACGEMHMARPLAEYFASVRASDCYPYDPATDILDFTTLGSFEPPVDWIITNPPFALAQEFIETALKVASAGVAMLVRSAFLEGQDRHAELFLAQPPSFVLQFAERVLMLEGKLVRRGAIHPDDPAKRITSATAYCWLIWLRGREGEDCRLRWIPPSIDRLERPGDYPPALSEILPLPAEGLFGGAAS